MDILAPEPPKASPVRWIPAVSTTGVPVLILEPTYRQAAAAGQPLTLTLDLEPLPEARAEDRFSEPHTLDYWADGFEVSEKTCSRWFRSGDVVARKVGRFWSVAERDIPRRLRTR